MHQNLYFDGAKVSRERRAKLARLKTKIDGKKRTQTSNLGGTFVFLELDPPQTVTYPIVFIPVEHSRDKENIPFCQAKALSKNFLKTG